LTKVGRNQPCLCGSGRKAKRCCGVEGGPSEKSLARAYLAHAQREATADLEGVSDAEFETLWNKLVDLPELDLSLQVELSKLFSPELDRLCEAIADQDDEAVDDALGEALETVDTPSQRARLAAAVVALRDAGRLDARVGATALIDLGSNSRELLCASLIQAAAVRAGAARTPAGLRLAA